MKKILLDFDEVTGSVCDATGYYVGTYLEIKGHKQDETMELGKIIKLKDAGFDTDEIIKMNKEGLI